MAHKTRYTFICNNSAPELVQPVVPVAHADVDVDVYGKYVSCMVSILVDSHCVANGLLISDRGHFITAGHVMRDVDQSKMVVETCDHQHYSAVIVKIWSAHNNPPYGDDNLALLKLVLTPSPTNTDDEQKKQKKQFSYVDVKDMGSMPRDLSDAAVLCLSCPLAADRTTAVLGDYHGKNYWEFSVSYAADCLDYPSLCGGLMIAMPHGYCIGIGVQFTEKTYEDEDAKGKSLVCQNGSRIQSLINPIPDVYPTAIETYSEYYQRIKRERKRRKKKEAADKLYD